VVVVFVVVGGVVGWGGGGGDAMRLCKFDGWQVRILNFLNISLVQAKSCPVANYVFWGVPQQTDIILHVLYHSWP